MTKQKLFQYAVLFHPTEKEVKDLDLKSEVVCDVKTILAYDQQKAAMAAAMELDSIYKEKLDQIEIIVRPF